jgi:hypothetical protein
MDELLLFFRRLGGLTTEEFGRHYLDVHGPMATAWVRVIGRYVVNLPDVGVPPPPPAVGAGVAPDALELVPVDPDAVTEVWVDSVAAFRDRRQAFADVEQGRTMRDDHNSFIGTMHGYRVEREVDDDRLVGMAADAAVRLLVATWSTTGAEPRAADPAGVLVWDRTAVARSRFVVRRVAEPITPDAPRLVRVEELTVPSLAALATCVDLGAAPPAPGRGVVVTRHVLGEHVQRAANR